MTEDNNPHEPFVSGGTGRVDDEAPQNLTAATDRSLDDGAGAVSVPALTVPGTPPGPDIPVPVPGGPDPTPEVPDVPEIPSAPDVPPVPDVPDVPEIPSIPERRQSPLDVAGATKSGDSSDVTAPAPEPVADEPLSVQPEPVQPTAVESKPVEPMPVVTPNPRPAPMPTVTPNPRPVPMPMVAPTPPLAEPAGTPAPAAAEPVDRTPTGDSEPPVAADAASASASAAASEATPATSASAPGQHAPGSTRQQGQRPRGGRPGGRPGGRANVRPSPVPSAPQSAGVVEPIVESVDPHLWGRIDGDGVVYVMTAAGERAIGNWQAGDNEAGLAHFGRKFDDFSTEIALLEARLASGSGDPKATKTQAIALRESVETLAAIGDLDGAAIRLEIVIGAADAAIAGASHARTAARAAAIKAKEALCVEAEELAESTQWKATGDRLKAIVEEWRAIRGIDRKTDDALWKRFAKARDTFTRHRGSHFAELDKQRGAAREAKEALIAKAEALSDATEWGETAGAYRELMEEWKAIGRAPRDVEDALWARFRAAQEKFFSRRNKTFSDRDAEFEANAKVKEQLLAEAEKIDPAAGLDAAKAKMRSIQERWEAAGKVPRERIKEFDNRLRAIEDKVKSAEDRHWRRTDPETTARVEQFRSRVDTYRTQAAKARAAGDERKAREADAQAKQWEEWLRTAQSAVDG
jgi:hypothetical protein